MVSIYKVSLILFLATCYYKSVTGSPKSDPNYKRKVIPFSPKGPSWPFPAPTTISTTKKPFPAGTLVPIPLDFPIKTHPFSRVLEEYPIERLCFLTSPHIKKTRIPLVVPCDPQPECIFSDDCWKSGGSCHNLAVRS